MTRSGRTVAVAAALLSVVVGATPAMATYKARAVPTTEQSVESGSWRVSIWPSTPGTPGGTTPVMAQSAPLPFSATLLNPQYAMLTNFGSRQPGTMDLQLTGPLVVGITIEGCRTQWTTTLVTSCPTGPITLRTSTAVGTNLNTDPATIPVPGETFWLKLSTVATISGSVSVAVTRPVPGTTNS